MDRFKCPHCGETFTNPEIYRHHKNNCLKVQEINGINSKADNPKTEDPDEEKVTDDPSKKGRNKGGK